MKRYILIVLSFIFLNCARKNVQRFQSKEIYCPRYQCKKKISIETKFINIHENNNYENYLLNTINREIKKKLNVHFAEYNGLHCDEVARIYVSFEIGEEGSLKKLEVRAPRKEFKIKTIESLNNISGLKPYTEKNISEKLKYKIVIEYKVIALSWFDANENKN